MIIKESSIKNKKPEKPIMNCLLPVVVSALTCWCLIFSAASCPASDISVDVRIQSSDIYVTSILKPNLKFIEDINRGVSKEMVFYVDLFRVWKILPDEFVTGKKLMRRLKIDPIRREYKAINIDGNIHLEKRLKDIESLIDWASNLSDVKLTNIRELEPGAYFVKVTVESVIRKLPPVVGYLLFFVPEREFTVTRDSAVFQLKTAEVDK